MHEVWKSSKYMKIPRKCTGPKKLWKMEESDTWEVMIWSDGGNESKDSATRERRQKVGAMLDEGFMAENEKVCAALQNVQPAFTAEKKGRTVSRSRSRKKSGLSWTRKKRRRNIERSEVLKPAGIGA